MHLVRKLLIVELRLNAIIPFTNIAIAAAYPGLEQIFRILA